MMDELSKRLIRGGLQPDTPAAIVYKATWPEERSFICTVGTLGNVAKKNDITKTAVVLAGEAVTHASFDRSKLYDPDFTTGYRKTDDR